MGPLFVDTGSDLSMRVVKAAYFRLYSHTLPTPSGLAGLLSEMVLGHVQRLCKELDQPLRVYFCPYLLFGFEPKRNRRKPPKKTPPLSWDTRYALHAELTKD